MIKIYAELMDRSYYIYGIDISLRTRKELLVKHFALEAINPSEHSGYIDLSNIVFDFSINDEDIDVIYEAYKENDNETLMYYKLKYAK